MTKGTTSAQHVKETCAHEVQFQEVGRFGDCVTALLNKTVDALTNDDLVLAGYAAQQPGKVKLVGKGFSTENLGVGLKKDDTQRRPVGLPDPRSPGDRPLTG